MIVGRRKRQNMKDLKHCWPEIRKRAELDGFRLHDLRHSFASFAAGRGVPLQMIGSLLGHRHHSTTERYAHLADDPRQAAATLIGNEITAIAAGEDQDGERGKVVKLKRRAGRGGR